MNILRLSTLSLTLAIAVITLGLAAAPAFSNPADADGCHTHKDCGGGGDSGKLPEMHTLLFEPRGGPTGSGLLTIHANNGAFDYTARSNVGCPSGSANAEWDITSVKTSNSGVLVYEADGPDLIIDLLADGVGLDGCFGATTVDSGLFKLELRKTGKGRNTSCEARILWNFNHTSQTDYLSMQSDGWIPLLTPPFDQCDKKSQENSVLIDGLFLFSETTTGGGTVPTGSLALAYFVVFH